MISSSSQLKAPTVNASLADSLGIPQNESLKTKIPLRQIVQFAERLQTQNSEVIGLTEHQVKAELQKIREENISLKKQRAEYDCVKYFKLIIDEGRDHQFA